MKRITIDPASRPGTQQHPEVAPGDAGPLARNRHQACLTWSPRGVPSASRNCTAVSTPSFSSAVAAWNTASPL